MKHRPSPLLHLNFTLPNVTREQIFEKFDEAHINHLTLTMTEGLDTLEQQCTVERYLSVRAQRIILTH